jgi:hypothetical protein
MGIFMENVEYINRDCIKRTITFDGQRASVEPNYDKDGKFLKDVHNFLPKICIPYALNQNVVMNSEDAIDPSDFQSYVVPKIRKRKKGKETDEYRYDFSFLPSSKNTSKTRVDLTTYLDDPSLKVLEGRGKFKASEAGVASGVKGIANQHINEDE